MKIIFTIILLLLILFSGCHHNKTQRDDYYDLKKQIIGIWGDAERNPGLYISPTSIFSTSWEDSNSYFFIKDTFFVKFNDRDTATPFGKMSVNNDTLSWVARDGMKIFAYKCK